MVLSASISALNSQIFASKLKLANIEPVHKKTSKNSKENYRPVSVLSNISKLYEKSMSKQMSEYFESSFIEISV